MQIVEKNSFDVRVVVSRFKRRDTPLQFVLLPMVHIGSPEYYAAIVEKLRDADTIIYEGVSSRRARPITRAHRLIARFNDDGLIYQSTGIDLKEFRDKLVHGDVSIATFDEEWKSIPLRYRATLWLLLPFFTLYVLAVGTKASVARVLTVDDLPSRDEILRDGPEFEAFDHVIIDVRDARLLESMQECFDDHRSEDRTVAVLYGASHMREVVRFLTTRLDYRLVSSEWVVVFEL